MRTLKTIAATVAIAAVALWPLTPLLHAPPATRDALLWIQRGAGADWLAWAVTQQHFVGYRPLAALSFTLNAALGATAEGYRAADLGLYVLSGGLLAALAQRWFGMWPALLAAGLYFFHPTSEEILIDVARRSYPMSASLVLSAFLLIRRRALAAVLLGAAMLCNEVAVVPALLGPAVLRWRAPEHRWRAGWPLWAAVAAVAALRLVVLRGGGGYDGSDIVLPWLAGGPLAGDAPLRPLLAAAAGAYQTLLPVAGDGSRSLLGQHPIGIGSAAVAALVIGRALWQAGAPGRLLLGWYAATLILAAVAVTWFWRMAHPPLLPLCLAAALLAQRRDWLALGAAVLLGGNMALQSPVIKGPRPLVGALDERAALITQIEAAAEGQGTLLLVLPYTKHWAVSTERWLAFRHPAVVVSLLAYQRSLRQPIAADWPARPDTIKVHEDAFLTEAGQGLLQGPRLLSASQIPPKTALVWVGEDRVGVLPVR